MRFEVGEDLIIETIQRKVTLAGQTLDLPERSYLLLLTLVEQAPNIVSHDTLIEIIWPGRVVTDENLKQRVSRLRKTLNNADYLIAERGLGYRLSATVNKVSQPDEPEQTQLSTTDEIQPQPPTKTSKLKYLAFAAFVALGAVATLQIVKTQDSSSDKLGPFTAKDYNQQGIEYYYRFKPSDNNTAITLFNKAISIDPNFSPAYAGLGNAYAQGFFQYGKDMQWLVRAVDNANQAIEIAPKQPYGYKALGLAKHLAGRFDESLTAYEKAIELAPWWQSPVNNRAFVLFESGDLYGAYQDALKTIKMDVKDPIPYLFIGMIYSQLEMKAHALKSIKQSIDFKPDYLLAQNYLAQYYFDNKQYVEAQKQIQRVLADNPTSQFAHWLAGLAFLHNEQSAIAEQHFAQAAVLGGRYKVPAQVYWSLIKGDRGSLEHNYQQLTKAINDGMQWPEYYFAKALIEAQRGDHEPAHVSLKQALKVGFIQPNRLLSTPWLQPMTQKPDFLSLLTQLKQSIGIQRKQVMKIAQN